MNSTPRNRITTGSDPMNLPIQPVSSTLSNQTLHDESIELYNVTKTYHKDNNIVALDNLSLSIYSGQITVLLGPNGAGKTTLLNLLTGIILPSSGQICIQGKDITKQLDEIRPTIGICYQQNTYLFNNLTVREHLHFFLQLKKHPNDSTSNNNVDTNIDSKSTNPVDSNHATSGSTDQQEEGQQKDNGTSPPTTNQRNGTTNLIHVDDIDKILCDFGLREHCDTLVKHLRGGLKRKLCIAIALCGSNKVILLDEPTIGMDPYSRRTMWNVIRHYKKDRCILLTTHSMEEAEVLGDRIVILSNGRLRCCGTSHFLKSYYGVGYYLSVSKHTDTSGSEKYHSGLSPRYVTNSSTNDFETIARLIEHTIPGASLVHDLRNEIKYYLPICSGNDYVSMFEGLDAMVDSETISNYGIVATSLDEVFVLATTVDDAKECNETCAPQESKQNRFSFIKTLISKYRNKPTNRSITEMPTIPIEDNQSEDDKKNGVSNYSDSLTLNEADRGLFWKHLRTLTHRRMVLFKRDTKALLYTTFIPTLLVFIGFLVLKLSTKSIHNLPPQILSINGSSEGTTSSRRMRVAYNSPTSTYPCSAGLCAYKNMNIADNNSKEKYLFCGEEAVLEINNKSGYESSGVSCSVPWTSDVMTVMATDLELLTKRSNSLLQSSQLFLNDSETDGAGFYGAVWFTHFSDSKLILNVSSNYDDSVVNQCHEARPYLNYTNVYDCDRFRGVGYVLSYNFTFIHAAPALMALTIEALARYARNNSNFKIMSTIAPLPLTRVEDSQRISDGTLTAWFLIMISFSLIAGTWAAVVVTEERTKFKHLLTLSGINKATYWFSFIFWDVLSYQIPLWITVALILLFHINVLTNTDRDVLSGIIALIFLYGPASAGFTYCVAFSFSSGNLCQVAVIATNFLIGLGGPLTCYLLQLYADDSDKPKPNLASVADGLTWILRFTPTFCLGKGLFNAIHINQFVYLEKNVSLTAWEEPILLYEVYYLAWQSILFPLLRLLVDIDCLHLTKLSWLQCLRPFSPFRIVDETFKRKGNSDTQVASTIVDDDVIEEYRDVEEGKFDSDLILIKNMSKIYPDGTKAIDNLSFAIGPGKCFGLLGANGAGKTTVMGILTAEFPSTHGDVILSGQNVTNVPYLIRRSIGYCPQDDVLSPNLTGWEHVEFYARIKGVPDLLIKPAVATKLRDVGIHMNDRDRLCSEYSYGMRRRLSLACALVGAPQIMLLDEPTTGIDPVNRRDIWLLLNELVLANRQVTPSVLIVTQSTDECEALCHRVGIMSKGRLNCLGSIDNLKIKYGNGYKVSIAVNVIEETDSDYKLVLDFLRDYHGSIANYSGLEYVNGSTRSEKNVSEYFNFRDCVDALQSLTNADTLCSLVQTNKQAAGSFIWSSAVLAKGIEIRDLCSLVTMELRLQCIEKFMSQNFPGTILSCREGCRLQFDIDRTHRIGFQISSTFAILEEDKERLQISAYSVSQASLEDVFYVNTVTLAGTGSGATEHGSRIIV